MHRTANVSDFLFVSNMAGDEGGSWNGGGTVTATVRGTVDRCTFVDNAGVTGSDIRGTEAVSVRSCILAFGRWGIPISMTSPPDGWNCDLIGAPGQACGPVALSPQT